MDTSVSFSQQVKSGCKMTAVLLGILVITLPVSVWFCLRQSKGRLSMNDQELRVLGLGFGETRWSFDQIERLGVLRRSLPSAGLGGAIAKKMSGGSVAVNLCAKMKGGKVRYFMLSRYEGHEALLDEISKRANRPVEEVKQGLGGPKFADA